MSIRAPAGPILLLDPEPALLPAILDRAEQRAILCASASPDRLAQLRGGAGLATDIAFYQGTLAGVLRDFPLYWAEIHLWDGGGLANLADALASQAIIHWHAAEPDQARHYAALLVEHGAYASADAVADGVMLTAIAGLPAQAGLSRPEGWDLVRAILDAQQPAPPLGDALLPLRQAWLRAVDPGPGQAWPFRPAALPETLPPTLPDGRPWPLISIVTPSFNQARYLEANLLSVRRQAYPAIEHIVIDGGSTDGSVAILERYRPHLTHIVSEADRGQSHAINKGMALAKGEILAWLNSDDMLAPGALAAVAMGFAQSNADLVAGICCIHRDGMLIERHLTGCADGPLLLDELLDLDGAWHAGKFFYQPEVFFSRALWQRAGGRVDETLRYSMDWELWLRFAEQGARLKVLGRELAWFRRHDAQKTAVEAGFKDELQRRRDAYLAQRGRSQPPPHHPGSHNRVLRFALVNDIGWRYGAGIAQQRLADAITRAGHSAVSIALAERAIAAEEPQRPDPAALEALIAAAAPDLVLVGNIHGARLEPAALAPIMARWPTLVVMHDLWWLTGRCIYPGTCRFYLTGCDAACPTPDEYPALAPALIERAWRDRRLLYGAAAPPILLANSAWAEGVARAALGAAAPPIERIRLSFPLDLFRPRDRARCRELLGLPQDRFIILASAASLLEPRKGAGQLRQVIRSLTLPGLLFATIGHGDIGGLEIPPDRLIGLGATDDPLRVAEAYAAADVVVQPSTEETFGQVLVEAIACGTPVIAHGVTGAAEAVGDGVTGLLTRAANAAELEAAILELYRRPGRRRALASWGRIHSENEHSPEAAWRSLALALARTGLAARLGLAPKLTFPAAPPRPAPPARLGGESWIWRPGSGIGPREGPYPQFDMPSAFHWCCGPDITVELNCRRDGRHLLVLECQNPLFDRQEIVLRRGETPLGHAALQRTAPGLSALVSFRIELAAGRHLVSLAFSRWQEPDAVEARRLALMLWRLDMIALDAAYHRID
jgi:glycosyltransferase involved in cell wall biosynthesis